jgi:predicted DNA-binding transcriptional regulator YafY
MSDNRNEQVIRIFRIVDFLSSSRYGKTIQQIHAHLTEHGFNVNERTVRRDIKALEGIMAPVSEEKKDGSSLYKLQPNSFFSQQFVMTPRALLGFYLLKTLSTYFRSSPFSKDFQELFLTVDSCLNEKAQEFFQELIEVIHPAGKMQWSHLVDQCIFATLQAACSERQILEASYESASGGLRERRLGPHGIYFNHGSFYLLAEDLDSRSLKTFAVPRFKSARIIDEAYTAPKTDPTEFYQNSFGVFRGEKVQEIVLEFSRDVGAFAAETLWHPTQTTESLTDGRTRLNISIALTPDFVNWVLSFGENVTVVKPESLKQKIYEIASALQKRYESKKAS